MIPAFLRAVAAQVRALVQSGTAVHVTDADAVELEMIAGLDGWEELAIKGECNSVPGEFCAQPSCNPAVTPADIALGWLRASRTHIAYEASGGCPFDEGLHEVEGVMLKRAAVCAELALISGCLHRNPDMDCSPYLGTVEGARAAWSFVAEQLSATVRPRIFNGPAGPSMSVISGPLLPTEQARVDKYRRELEAMR